jgi:ABC-2 type transport system permease protein
VSTVATFNPANWAVEAGREALAASPDWSFVLARVALLIGLTILAIGFATRTFRSYQRSI